MIRIHAPAKVNLALRVLARETSGYHQLETVFAALEFGDALSVSIGEGGETRLKVEGPEPCPTEENLVFRAAEGFRELADLTEGLDIQLEKNIPAEAGLGGGSSDAAATLRGLESLFPGRVEEGDLMRLAASLGSDVPFFLGSGVLALAWGRGDRVLPLPALPSAPVLLAIPPFSISTASAYGRLAALWEGYPPAGRPRRLDLADFQRWSRVQTFAKNDFEEVLFPDSPLLARIRESLEETGARFSLLSGSGSAIFGVFRGEEEVVEAKASLRSALPEVRFIRTRTLESLPEPSRLPGTDG